MVGLHGKRDSVMKPSAHRPTLEAVFDRVRMLRELEPQLKEDIFASFTCHAYEPNECIQGVNEPAKTLYIIHEGDCGVFEHKEKDNKSFFMLGSALNSRYASMDESGRKQLLSENILSSSETESLAGGSAHVRVTGQNKQFDHRNSSTDGNATAQRRGTVAVSASSKFQRSARTAILSASFVHNGTRKDVRKAVKGQRPPELVKILGPKSFFGEMALFCHGVSAHSFIAQTDVTVLRLDGDVYREKCMKYHRERYFFARSSS
jgi:CRP-like cAMP-binding protein